jgi:hypothetical protein
MRNCECCIGWKRTANHEVTAGRATWRSQKSRWESSQQISAFEKLDYQYTSSLRDAQAHVSPEISEVSLNASKSMNEL